MRIERCPLTSPVQGEKQKKTLETLPFIQWRGRGRGGEGREGGGGGERMIPNWERKSKRIVFPPRISSRIRQNAREFLLELHLPKGN